MHRRNFIKEAAIAGSVISMSPIILQRTAAAIEVAAIKKAASAPAKNMKVTIAQTLVENDVLRTGDG
jgi:hypothetical protein